MGLLERRPGAEPREDLACRGEGRCRLRRSAERHEAAPPAEQRLGLLVGDLEVAPAGGGVGEVGRRRCMLPLLSSTSPWTLATTCCSSGSLAGGSSDPT